MNRITAITNYMNTYEELMAEKIRLEKELKIAADKLREIVYKDEAKMVVK